MITISLCMIVKNEEERLPGCLESLAGLMDEMVIVDTGSTDRTADVAKRFGARVYTYVWRDDFSAARNYAFSKATGDYIYSADADEILRPEEAKKFMALKERLTPDADVELVQMYYCNQLEYRTVYNYDREPRPKLFKRLRPFIWEDPIHEQVRLMPAVLDSGIEIDHRPGESHAARDLANFRKATEGGRRLSKRLHGMYARELFMAGEEEDFRLAEPFFRESVRDETRSVDEVKEACCVAAHAARIARDAERFLQYALKDTAAEGSSEMCCELGDYYREGGDYREAAMWYYNAAFETVSILDTHRGGDIPLRALADCCRALGDEAQAREYEAAANAWKPPAEQA